MKRNGSSFFFPAIVLTCFFLVSALSISVAGDTGWCIEALSTARDTLAEAERTHGTNSHLVVSDLLAFATACADAEDYEMAKITYARAAQLQKQTLKDIDNDLLERLGARITALNRLGQVCLKLRQFETAETAFNRAISNAQLVFSPTNDEVKVSRTGFALTRAYHMRFENAEPFYTKVLAATENAFGEKHAEVARVLEEQVSLYKTMEKLAEAEKTAQRLVRIRKKIMPDDHPATATALNVLASILYERRDYKHALSLLKEALEIRKKAFGTTHLRTKISLNNLAELYEEMGNTEKAAEYRATSQEMMIE